MDIDDSFYSELKKIYFNGYTHNYLLELNSNINIKFLKDELTIKYLGKGVSNSDYAVSSL